MTSIALLILAVLLLSGFFSGAEATLLTITQAEVESFLQQKRLGARVLDRVKRHINRSVIAIVILNNAVNIVGSVMVGNAVLNMYGDAALAVATTALTFGVIIFSEILPKSMGMHYAHVLAIPVSFVIEALTTVLLPLIYVLEVATNALKRGERKIGTEDQIRSLVSIGRRSGHIENDEGQLIHRAFILNDKCAENIMTDLKDIISVPYSATIRACAETVFQHTYSRYPVFGASIHDVEGLLMSKDLLESLTEGKDQEPILGIMREILIVDAKMPADKLLVLFRDRHIHLAIVQREGKTVGLITLEDVLEELVGEIEDETDTDAN